MRPETRKAWRMTLIAFACVAPIVPVLSLVTGHVFKGDAIARIAVLSLGELAMLFIYMRWKYGREA